MAAVGEAGVYKAPTDVQAGNPQVLARVGPGTLNAAIVTAVSGDIVNLRVFPDQQSEFSLRGIGIVDDPLVGFFTPGAHPEAPPAGDALSSRTKTTTPPPPVSRR